jgi:hypothetical protein
MAVASILPSGVILVVTAGNTPFQLDIMVSPRLAEGGFPPVRCILYFYR